MHCILLSTHLDLGDIFPVGIGDDDSDPLLLEGLEPHFLAPIDDACVSSSLSLGLLPRVGTTRGEEGTGEAAPERLATPIRLMYGDPM
jgi:hypothetical protein